MNFFEQQDKARSKTARLVIMFLIGLVGLAIIAFVAVFMGYILLLGDGYNVEEEFKFYGNYISDVHIKDRVFNGGSVELGSGDADFDALVIELKKIDYSGLIILQAYRDDEGLNIFDKQYNFFGKKFKELI